MMRSKRILISLSTLCYVFSIIFNLINLACRCEIIFSSDITIFFFFANLFMVSGGVLSLIAHAD